MTSDQSQKKPAKNIRIRGRYAHQLLESELLELKLVEDQESFGGGASPFSKVNPFPSEWGSMYRPEHANEGFINLFNVEDRFSEEAEPAPFAPKNPDKESEIFNNMKRQFELRIRNLPLQDKWRDTRKTPQQLDLKYLSKLLLTHPSSQLKKQEEQIENLTRQLQEIKSKNILERKGLEAEKRQLQAERESIKTHDYKRRPRSSTEDELELQRQLDVRWSSTERELEKRFDQMESLKNGLLSMQENLRKEKLELEKKSKEQDERTRRLERLINPTQFVERERKLTCREKDVKRREDACKKKEEDFKKRKELIKSRETEADRRLAECKDLERKVKEDREKLAQEKQSKPSDGRVGFSSYSRQNVSEERARLFQKETMLLQKERSLTQREQSIQEREKSGSMDAQKIAQDNMDADKEEVMKQKAQVALQMDEVLAEKKKLQDLRRLTHRAQTAFDRESSKERARLSELNEKLTRIQERFGDHKDIVMKIQEQEDELAKQGEELLALYEDIQDQENQIRADRQKLRQERLKFNHERSRILHNKPNSNDNNNLEKMKEMHKELKVQVNAMKELKAQISHLIISEQIDWVRFPELREQVVKLTKVDPLDPPSPSSSGKSRASYDTYLAEFDDLLRSVKYETPRSSPRSKYREKKKPRFDAHGSPYYSFKSTGVRHLSLDNPLFGYE